MRVNEVQRQAWLNAFGLTPWVATQSLPGAAASTLLDWPERDGEALRSHGHVATQDPTHAAGVASIPHASPAADARRDVPRSNVPHNNAQREHAADNVASANFVAADSAAAKDAPPTQPARARATSQATPITLQAHQIGNSWLVVEQEDPGAPDLGRDAVQLLNNILTVLPGERRGTRKFIWPLPGVAGDDSALSRTFVSFARGLGGRLLLCVSEDTLKKLLPTPRYTLFSEGVDILPVSALQEMLREPVPHKRDTWQAMVEYRFNV